ncbi:polyprenol reductase isoform X2 [Pleurodeles waltl]|uniref:polyprenol reductase isoform X2 n=1 Tax=Pleurodeles waltl TaxID=8319 RepID=UPI0037096905
MLSMPGIATKPNFLDCLWLTLAVAFLLAHLLHRSVSDAYFPRALHCFFEDVIRYGKTKSGWEGQRFAWMRLCDLPKRWFSHFYVVSVLWNGFLIMVLIHTLFFGHNIPAWLMVLVRRLSGVSQDQGMESISKKRCGRGDTAAVNAVHFYCLCCFKQTENSTTENKEPRKKCVCTYNITDFEKEAPGVPYNDIWPVKGFAKNVVNTCLKRDFYILCSGHKINDPQQEAHECLCTSYTSRIICHVCSLLSPHKVYKLLRFEYVCQR